VTRRAALLLLAVLLLAAASPRAAESLRIVPLVDGKQVVVSLELTDAYNDDIREMIASGLRTTFTYDVELRMVVAGWVDRTIATSVVSITDQYDNLTRRHSLSRTVDGRIDESLVTEDDQVVARWLTSVTRLPVCSTTRLERNREYYVRVSARKKPQHSLPFAWASSLTGQAKFTFTP
jgi:Domain of unknown function (DUF4390)